ncbi:MAG: type II secretion system F family protein [Lachnospiraceae bacterium]|nr:type II secretion system F family protein [Lachnospiraceae bacterium]
MVIALMAVYVVFAGFWIFLLIQGGKNYSDMIEPLDKKSYMLKSLYPVGFEFLSFIHYSYQSNSDKKRLEQCKIIFGEKYGEYYFRVSMAERYTYLITYLMPSPLIGLIFGNPIFCLAGPIVAFVMFYYADTKITDITKKREEKITDEFCNMISKMALLINAGMITKEAWDKIADSSEGILYEEMRRASQEIANGVAEVDAYIGFGDRCDVAIVKKFVSMLVQNLSKGNKELVDFLKSESALSWEEKKHLVKRKGEAASSKLMIPLTLIMIGIFVMILVPICSKIGF